MISSAFASPTMAGSDDSSLSSAMAKHASYKTLKSSSALNVCLPSKIMAFPSAAAHTLPCLQSIIGLFKMLTPKRPAKKSVFNSLTRLVSTSRHPLSPVMETSAILKRCLSSNVFGAITCCTFAFFAFGAPAAAMFPARDRGRLTVRAWARARALSQTLPTGE